MTSTIDLEKKELRLRVREELSALSRSELVRGDDALFARFLALPQVEAAKTIFAFWGIPGKEPDTARLIQELVRRGKTVGLPRMLPGHRMEVRRYDPDRPLVKVSFGISEPGEDCPLIRREDIDLTLVPAVCYDRRGFRLGFGGGYYDRWLEHFSGVKAGLCRETVLQDRVPTEAHDAKVDILLTEGESLSL
ncbi:MAG: 5-formyltetrahydrofolate cyclo-ligase [Lawsonibacter sp.]|jgi:5-formyltetrahydrofolate cyclo-ligase|nr:5-formyltetrahydrofolate cyclo-ligase [Lawsonibacter sp.]